MTAPLPPSVARVRTALVAAGAPEAAEGIRLLDAAARTAAQAAAALGCEVGAIASSLVFRAHPAAPGDAHAHDPADADDADDADVVLVLTSGAHRVDTGRVARHLGLAGLGRADAALVRTRTGFAIGGVPPLGHPRPLRTVVDVALADHRRVWAAAGHPHAVFPTTYAQLVAVTGGSPLQVAAPTAAADGARPAPRGRE